MDKVLITLREVIFQLPLSLSVLSVTQGLNIAGDIWDNVITHLIKIHNKGLVVLRHFNIVYEAFI